MTNEEMVVKFQQGEVAFEEILAKNEKLIYREFHRWSGFTTMEEDEKYNLLLVALWESAQDFDVEAGVKFSTFASNNLYFKIKNTYRSSKSKKNGGDLITVSIEQQMEEAESHSFEANVAVVFDFLDRINTEEIKAIVERVLAKHDENKKKYVRSFLYDGMTYSEIAREYGMKPAPMTTTIKRVLAKVQAEVRMCGY